MQSRLVSFIQVLRSHDVRVSPAETLDAMDVGATLVYADRERLRDGLGMALAKTPEEEALYLQCFDRFFCQELADFSTDEENGQPGEEPAEPQDAGDAVPAGEAAGVPAAPRQGRGCVLAVQSLRDSDLPLGVPVTDLRVQLGICVAVASDNSSRAPARFACLRSSDCATT